jgi:penicillin-binding protein 1A
MFSRWFIRTKQLLTRENRWFRRIVFIIWLCCLGVFAGIPIFIWAVERNPFDIFGGMPALRQVENPENDLSSEVISADGVSLGRYFTNNRSELRYEHLPEVLVSTLIISEDHRFHKHSGMDFWSYLRVLYGITTFNLQGGGSTLSQQTAKNLFHTREDELRGRIAKLGRPADLFISKTKEWILAVKLERNLTKEEIIALYLNTVAFNHNAYGIKVASETYFNKRVRDLSLQESALLVGMLQSPYLYNPVRFPERAKSKRNDVLWKLFQHGYLPTRRSYDSIAALPVTLDFRVQTHNEGLATYFRTILKADMLKWCRDRGYDLFESGLKIHVTLDSRLQYFAEQAVREHMTNLQAAFEGEWGARNPWVDSQGREQQGFVERKIKNTDYYRQLVRKYGQGSDSISILLSAKKRMKVFTWQGERDTVFSHMDSVQYYNRFLHTGLMAMDPLTGEVRAWVGGINHKYFMFDHVVQARRQPGSTFKAFVYGKAIEDRFSPCDIMNDVSPTININGKIYHPANANGSYGDGSPYTMRQALARSLNSVTMQLMEKIKPANVVDFANRVGIESKLEPVYSLGLGTSEVTVFEMVGAYSSFVNLGIHTKPFYISRIEDKHGNVVESFTPERRQVLDEATAYKMIFMLKGVTEEEGGVNRSLSQYVMEDNEIGGKTGTTDNASDGWYIGITPNLVTGVWVGGDEPGIRFPSWRFGSGARTALPIWDSFMQKVYMKHEDYQKGRFRTPRTNVDPKDLECISPAESDAFSF